MDHPNVIRPRLFFHDLAHAYVEFDYFHGGDLASWLAAAGEAASARTRAQIDESSLKPNALLARRRRTQAIVHPPRTSPTPHDAEPGAERDGEARGLVHDVLRGLEHVHARGVVHCDVRPANVLMRRAAAGGGGGGGGRRWEGVLADFDISLESQARRRPMRAVMAGIAAAAVGGEKVFFSDASRSRRRGRTELEQL